MDLKILNRIQRQIQLIWCKIKQVEIAKGIQSIIAGSNINIDNSDPLNPIISATGGGSITDQDNIPRFIEVTLAQIGSSDSDSEEDRVEKLRLWILAQNFVIGEKEIWYFQLERASTETMSFYPQVIITSNTEYEIIYNGSASRLLLTLQGSSTDVVLPPMDQTIGLVIIIKNTGSEISTVITQPEDTAGIWEGGITSQSINIGVGAVITISNDGIQYTII